MNAIEERIEGVESELNVRIDKLGERVGGVERAVNTLAEALKKE